MCGSQPPPIGDRVLTIGRLTGMGALRIPSQRALGAAQAVGIDFPTKGSVVSKRNPWLVTAGEMAQQLVELCHGDYRRFSQLAYEGRHRAAWAPSSGQQPVPPERVTI